MELPSGVYEPSDDSYLLVELVRSRGELDVAGKKVLEIGCGSGIVTEAVLSSAPELLVALDVNPDAVRVTMERVGGVSWDLGVEAGIPVLLGVSSGLRDIPPSLGPFDTVVCNPPYIPAEPGDLHLPVPDDDKHLPVSDNDDKHLPVSDNDDKHLPVSDNDDLHLPVSDNDDKHLPVSDNDLHPQDLDDGPLSSDPDEVNLDGMDAALYGGKVGEPGHEKLLGFILESIQWNRIRGMGPPRFLLLLSTLMDIEGMVKRLASSGIKVIYDIEASASFTFERLHAVVMYIVP